MDEWMRSCGTDEELWYVVTILFSQKKMKKSYYLQQYDGWTLM